jgi:hypothetical protein
MMYLLQQEPAQTLNYLVMGYVVIFGAMGIYLISLFIRQRNLKQDLQTLEELELQGEQK